MDHSGTESGSRSIAISEFGLRFIIPEDGPYYSPDEYDIVSPAKLFVQPMNTVTAIGKTNRTLSSSLLPGETGFSFTYLKGAKIISFITDDGTEIFMPWAQGVEPWQAD